MKLKARKRYVLLSALVILVLTAPMLISACCASTYVYEPEWTYSYDIETTDHQSYGIFGGEDWINLNSTIRQIVNGDYEEALEYANEQIASPAGYDTEKTFGHYIKVLTYSAMGELDDAWDALNAAIEDGNPMEMFMAGPKSLMQNLYEDPRFAAKVAEDNIMLVHGPMIGNVTDSSAQFWARTWVELPFQVYVYEKADLTGAVIKSDKKTTVPDDDMTAVVTVTGLEANTTYYYQVRLHDVTIDIDPVPSFKTYPEEDVPTQFAVGFGA